MARTFEIIPAIDLMDGEVVRLHRGAAESKVVYSSDPAAFARQFAAQGATRLHVVDLDGAFSGKPRNLAAIEAICAATSMRVELGGGIRTREQAQAAWDAGVDDVILGTSAIEDKEFAQGLLNEFPGQAIVGIDARDGRVSTRGWTRDEKITALDFAALVAGWGCRRIIYTDIATDGALAGPSLQSTLDLALHVPAVEVVASGGVSCEEDLQRISALPADNIAGVIVGKALYEGRVDLAQAVHSLQL